MAPGTAYICAVAGVASVRVLRKIEENLPKKKIGSAYEKGVDKFYRSVIDGLLECFQLPQLKAIVLASPGGFREELHKRLLDVAVKEEKRFILDARSKFVKVQVANGQVLALEEALKEPRIVSLLSDTKTALEAKLLDQFHKMHNHAPDMVAFSLPSVLKAAKEGAVKSLLLSDALFRYLQHI